MLDANHNKIVTYISKGEWFFKGSICLLLEDLRIGSGIFWGLRVCTKPDAEGGRPAGETYLDEEMCRFDEFDAQDVFVARTSIEHA